MTIAVIQVREGGLPPLVVDGAAATARYMARAEVAALSAEADAAAADLSATAAQTASPIYPDTATGLPATAANGYFSVVGDGTSTFAILYRKVSGSAVEQARYVSKSAYEAAGGAALIGTQAPGANAVSRTLQAKITATGIVPDDYSNLFTGAFARSIATATANGGTAYAWAGWNQATVALDQGIYGTVASLNADGSPVIGLQAKYPGTVTLDRRTDTDYLFTKNSPLVSSYIKGLNVFGGKGILRHSWHGNNVQGYHVIEDVVAMNYTECAWSSDSEDMPYVKVNRCVFRGSDTSIGFARSGLYDASSILDSEFHNGKYGIKLVGPRSSTMSIERSSFFTVRPDEDFTVNASKECDIWFGPSPTFAAAGAATVCRQIKFGNENMPLGAPRILFADEDAGSGSNVATRSHSTSISTGFIDGFSVLDSALFGNTGLTSSFIKSYTPNVSRSRFVGLITGFPHKHLIEFMGTEVAEDTYASRTNYVEIMPPSPGERAFQTTVSNRLIGVIKDPFGVMQDDLHVELNGFGDDTSFVLLQRLQGKDGSAFTVTKNTVATGFKGSPNAAEIIVASAQTAGGRSVGLAFDLGTVTPNRQSRLVIRLKQGSTRPINKIGYELYNTVTGKAAVIGSAIPTAEGARLDIKWVPPVGSPGNWRLLFYALDYAAGVRERFQVGTVSVYHSRTWMNDGDIRTIGTLAWNDVMIRDAGGVVWRDEFGAFRHLEGAEPTTQLNGFQLGRRTPTTVANLIAQGGAIGDDAFATNGRKVGQGPGAGTGCMAYHDGTGWFRASDDTALVA